MRFKLAKKLLLSGLSLISCMAVSSTFASSPPPLSADVGYVSLGNYSSASKDINPIRLAALKETATTLGARGGLAWRASQIDLSIDQQQMYLDEVFNFNQLLINGNVLPPVLVEANDQTTLDDNSTIRLAAKTYQIVAPAKFVTAAPSWRTYLWMDYKKPEMPDQTLLPQTQAEAAVWNQSIKEGWEHGLSQANSIFSSNLNRLKRDYLGIILYRKLLTQGMVSAPFVAKADLGVTGNENEMRIDDRVLRITQGSKLQTNPKKWTPVIKDPGKE